MCAIFGILCIPPGAIDRDKVKESSVLMKHRGPDAYRQWGILGTVGVNSMFASEHRTGWREASRIVCGVRVAEATVPAYEGE